LGRNHQLQRLRDSIPVRDLGRRRQCEGWFFNGDDHEVSNSGKFENGSLVLDFDSYAAKLKATVKDGVLEGEYGPMLKKNYPIRATRAVAKPKSNGPAPAPPSVAGQWDLQGVASSKGEKAWRLILRQSGRIFRARFCAWMAIPGR